jgi:signal transduction histidine kinase/ligand-binding sensor domain-containing protein/DNA-binding response OmpR family regulator
MLPGNKLLIVFICIIFCLAACVETSGIYLLHQPIPQTSIQEKIKIKKASTEFGFDISFTWTIFQDRKGFLWFGTGGGALRYDGLRFKSFKNVQGNINSLGGNTVRVFYEDHSGNMWIGAAGGGLNKFIPETEKFIRYMHNPDDPGSISSDYVYSIYEDYSGNLWIGTESGLNLFDRSTDSFVCYKNIPGDSTSISSNIVTAVFQDSKSNLWVGTIDGGLNLFNRVKNNFIRFMHNPDDPNSLSHNKVTRICEDKFGNLWITTLGGGLNKLIYKNGSTLPVFVSFRYNTNDPSSLSDDDIASIFIDDNNVMWLGTWGGGLNKTVSNLNDPILSFINFKNDPDDPNSLGSNNVYAIYQDNTGLIWIGNWGGSLNIINLKQKKIDHYYRKTNDPNSLSANGVMSVFEDKEGIIWIGTWDGGLNRWDRNSNKFTHYKYNKNDPFSLNDNTVSAVYEDKKGNLWIGTWNNGLNKFDRKTERFYYYKHDPENPFSISNNRILSIKEDNSGTLWIGTYYGGLNNFNPKTEKFIHYKNNKDDPNSLSSTDVHSLLFDRSGILWIGPKTGCLNSLDLKTKTFTRYQHDSNNPNSISHNKLSCMYEDRSGTLWIGTQDGGLNRFDRETGKFKSYRAKDGLAHEYVMGILEDDKGNLWISTSGGLSKFNIAAESFRNYYVEDGLQNNEFEELSAYTRLRSGEMIFGGPNGFNIFYPDSIIDNTHIPPVYITDFKLFNKSIPTGFNSPGGHIILNKSITFSEQIELNHSDNVFTLEFAALDFQAPNKNNYAFMLEGFDKEWIYTDAGNASATYTNLDPGEYIFRVKGSNNDRVWNEQGASLKIIVLPPWWRANLAYIFYFLLVGGTIFLIWKAQIRRLRNEHEYEMSKFEAKKLHEVDELKSRFFTNISHEFRTPLTLILGPSKQLLTEIKENSAREQLTLIHRSARKLNRLVDELLDISKIEAGEMKLKTCPLNIVSLVKDLSISYYLLAERKKIKLSIDSDRDEITAYIDKDKFDKILTNVLSNAVKFTPEGGKVDVRIKLHPQLVSGSQSFSVPGLLNKIPLQVRNYNHVEIKITDTGMGIPADQINKIFDRFYQVDGGHTREHEGTGIGLSLTKELIELHKGQIEVESQEGKGSTFTLIFPLGKDHLHPYEICEEELEKDNYELKELNGFDDYFRKKSYTSDEIESTDKPVLLIVEDNPDVRKYITMILGEYYQVIEAEDGEDGLNKSVEKIPDLIISDIMMPKMDGFKMCTILKTDERTSHIPIIMLTAKATIEDKISGLETGADAYIMKPFDALELKARIKNLLEQRKRLHEYFRKYGIVDTEVTTFTPADQLFLRKAVDLISKHISDQQFSVQSLSENLAVSKSLLVKKTEALFGEPPNELIRRIRLNKAARLLERKVGNISEIALEVGFNNPSYFADCFKRQFGVTPSQFHKDG